MTVRKIVVDSDIIIDHLTTTEPVSVLRRVMKEYFCYTTVFNAAELFAAARTTKETQAVEDALHAMKILGLNGKSAKNIAGTLRAARGSLNGLIAGVCIESRLPVVTMDPKRFAGIKKLNVITVKKMLQ
jgi:predicted nucleic acid-binding protein